MKYQQAGGIAFAPSYNYEILRTNNLCCYDVAEAQDATGILFFADYK